LPVEQVGEGRCGRVLEVGHEHLRAGVQRVDDHLALDRPGDLDAAILQRGRYRRDLPVRLADRTRFGQEVRQPACIERALAFGAPREQGAAGRIEAPVQRGQECQRCGRQDRLVGGVGPAAGLCGGGNRLQWDAHRLLHVAGQQD
jgi:hypothetical protein